MRKFIFSHNHQELTKKHLISCLKTGQFADVEIIAGIDQRRFISHKVLCSSCYVLYEQFIANEEQQVFTLENISGAIFERFIYYYYSGKLVFDDEKIEEFVKTARDILDEDIIDLLLKHMISNLNEKNCLRTMFFAKQFEIDAKKIIKAHKKQTFKTVKEEIQNRIDYKILCLLHRAKQCSQVYFKEVVKNSQQFLELSFDELEEYLSDDALQIFCEKEVFNAIIKWMNHDIEVRKFFMVPLLPLIRIGRLRKLIFIEYSNNNSTMFKEYKELAEYLNENTTEFNERVIKSSNRIDIDYNRILMIRPNYISSYEPYSTQLKILYTFGKRHAINCNSISVFKEKVITINKCTAKFINLKTGKWSNLPKKQIHQEDCRSVVLNERLYTIGGVDAEGEVCNFVETYNFDKSYWEIAAPMLNKRWLFGKAILNGRIYVIGGNERKKKTRSLRTVECYVPYSNRWEPCGSLIHKRSRPDVIVKDGYIYVYGGWDGNNLQETVEKYDPAENKWSIVRKSAPPLRKVPGRGDMGVVLFNNELHMLGKTMFDDYQGSKNQVYQYTVAYISIPITVLPYSCDKNN